MEYYYDYFLIGKDRNLSYPLTLQFELTDRCNLKCPYCYNNSNYIQQKTAGFDLEKWKKLFQNVVKSGGVFQGVLSGGEPLLLGCEIFELADILHQDGTGFVLITNGTLLEENIVKKMIKYKWFWIQVSLDSYLGERHDHIRGMVGAFKKIEKGIKLLVKYNLPVTISVVVTPKNIRDIEGIIQYAIELGVSNILFSEVLPTGRATFNKELALNKEYKKLFIRLVRDYSNKYNNININKAADHERYIEGVTKYKPTGLIIRPNGDVKTDCLSNTIIGNAFEKDIKDIWETYLTN